MMCASCGRSWQANSSRRPRNAQGDRFSARPILPIVLLEIAQIRRRLVLHSGHQEAVAAEEVNLLTDPDMSILFAANRVAEPGRLVGRGAPVGFVYQPWPGQSMIDGGDVIVQQIRVGLIEIDALLNDGLVVFVQRDAAGVENAWTLHATRLNHECVIAAVAVLIEPLAD